MINFYLLVAGVMASGVVAVLGQDATQGVRYTAASVLDRAFRGEL